MASCEIDDLARKRTVVRMVRAAHGYVTASDTLNSSMQYFNADTAFCSPSEVLLSLSIEILIKSIRLSRYPSIGISCKRHDSSAIWKQLPNEDREEIIHGAQLVRPNHFNPEIVHTYLKSAEQIFTTHRYGYEIYIPKSDAELDASGQAWVASGAPIDMADIGYHPHEWRALIESIFNYYGTNFYDFNYSEIKVPTSKKKPELG